MKQKEKFESLEMEVILFSNEEILMTSGPSVDEENREDPFG